MTPAMCLALAIYFEARSEPVEGQGAVADVVLNRVADDRYPDTVCDVVWYPSAFSWTHDGLSDTPTEWDAWHTAQLIANASLESDIRWIKSTHYHAVEVTPFWAAHYTFERQVGRHLFYVNDTPWR